MRPGFANPRASIYTVLGLQRACVRGIALHAEDLQGAERATRQLTFDPGDDRARRIEAAADKARARFGARAVMPAALARLSDDRRAAPGSGR